MKRKRERELENAFVEQKSFENKLTESRSQENQCKTQVQK